MNRLCEQATYSYARSPSTEDGDRLTYQSAERFGFSGIDYRQHDLLEPCGDGTTDRAAHLFRHDMPARLFNPSGFSDLGKEVTQLVAVQSSDLGNSVDVQDQLCFRLDHVLVTLLTNPVAAPIEAEAVR
jgi:hypothetical protein